MRGQPYNITEYLENKDGNKSMYSTSWRGLQNKERTASWKDPIAMSNINNLSPDPKTINTALNRREKFSNDMATVTKKFF